MTDVTAKSSSNYSEEMIASMLEEYQAAPSRETVDSLANRFGKTARSVIAKLSALGVYQKPAPTNKRGEPVVRKEEFVAQIQDSLEVEIPSLEKMTKADLQTLIAALQTR